MAINIKPVLYKGSVYIYFSKNQEAVRIRCGFKADKLLDSGYLGKTSGVTDVEEKNNFIKDKLKEVAKGIEEHPNLSAKEYKQYFKKGELPNPDNILEQNKQLSFLDAFQKYIDDSVSGKRVSKSGTVVKPNTITSYKNTLNTLKLYDEYSLKEKGIILDWNTVNSDFYFNFSNYQWQILDNTDNSLGLRNKIIKSFLNWCFDERIIDKPINTSKWITWKADTDRFVLHSDELNQINKLKDLPEKLEQARDIFLMGVFTCMRVENLLKLSEKDLRIIKNEYYIDFEVEKTKQQLMIKLNPIAVEIIKKYKGQYKTLLPYVSYVTFNNRLKALGKHIKQHFKLNRTLLSLKNIESEKTHWENGFFVRRRFKQGVKIEETIEIEKAMRTHVMRYSGITNALAMGLTPYEVCAISGHKLDSAEFVKYVNLSNTITQNKAVDLWAKAMA